jgi:hypothetical protein
MAKDRASNSIVDLFGGGRKSAAPKPEAPVVASRPSTREIGTRGEEDPSAIVSREETLVERVLKGRAHVKPEEAKDELAALHGVLQGLSQRTVVVVFALGKVLAEVKSELPHGEFIPWIEESCPFTRRSASSYMSVYERYKDEPRRALAELSITEAYIEAGVKKLSAPETEEVKQSGAATGLEDELPSANDFKHIFNQKTMSGVELKHHRVVPYKDGRIYVVRPELGPMKVADLFVDMSIQDPGYQDAIQEVHHNVAMALEVFYSKLEACEDRGVLGAPFDSSRAAMAGRMRNVSPEKKASKPAAKKAAKGRKA